MKSNLPTTNTITINPDRMENYLIVKIPAPKWISSYLEVCRGDSGSGQFISDGHRYILVAVYTTYIPSYKYKYSLNKVKHEVPCGTNSYHKKSGKYLKTDTISESTTWHENLDWIKQKSNI